MNVKEFLALPEVAGQPFELINGRVVRMDEVDRDEVAHEWVKSNLIEILVDWARQNPSMKLFSGATFQHEEKNARPLDIALMSRNRKPVGTNTLFQGGPQLAIEVVSSEKAADLCAKIDLFIAHGCKSVWVAHPEQRRIWIFDPSGQGRLFEKNQILEDPAVLPGFSAPVSAIFEGI